jgi:hypothetical protein
VLQVWWERSPKANVIAVPTRRLSQKKPATSTTANDKQITGNGIRTSLQHSSQAATPTTAKGKQTITMRIDASLQHNPYNCDYYEGIFETISDEDVLAAFAEVPQESEPVGQTTTAAVMAGP